jgi:hypothetical protein
LAPLQDEGTSGHHVGITVKTDDSAIFLLCRVDRQPRPFIWEHHLSLQ